MIRLFCSFRGLFCLVLTSRIIFFFFFLRLRNSLNFCYKIKGVKKVTIQNIPTYLEKIYGSYLSPDVTAVFPRNCTMCLNTVTCLGDRDNCGHFQEPWGSSSVND